jgi:membrane-bound lytic murein transglycosylase D
MKLKSILIILLVVVGCLTLPYFNTFAAKSNRHHRNLTFLEDVEFDSNLVSKWFRYYTKKGRKRFLRHLNRGEKYRTMVESIFLGHGLPIELYYVGLIESGYVLEAKSHQSAVGPWQFIKSTGKGYGLRVDSEIDERQNIYLSTHAAARYLSDLHNIFNNWALSIAAYNAGEYRILEAIRKGNTRSFNELIKQRLLPEETKNYVSKLWTAMMIDQYASEFDFHKKKTIKHIDKMNLSIEIKESYKLSKLVGMSGLKMKDFMSYNQHIKTTYIKASKLRPVVIYMPQSHYMSFALSLDGKKASKLMTNIVKVKNPDILMKLGFKNLTSGEKIEMTKLTAGRIRIKRLKNGKIIEFHPPKI